MQAPEWCHFPHDLSTEP